MRKATYLKFFAFAAITAMLVMGSCMKSTKFEEEERLRIQAYLGDNPSLHFELKPSGLYYLSVEEGSGAAPVTGDSVWFFYTGKFLSGQIFDSNVQASAPYGILFDKNELIEGMDEAIGYMKEGGKCMALVPSKLGYGSTGDYYGYIGGYTPLLFDVELVRVKHNSGK